MGLVNDRDPGPVPVCPGPVGFLAPGPGPGVKMDENRDFNRDIRNLVSPFFTRISRSTGRFQTGKFK